MKILSTFVLLICALNVYSQDNLLTVERAIGIALENNAGIKSSAYEVESLKQLRKTSIDLPKADVRLQYGQTNSFAKDNNLMVTQSIPFSAFGSQGALNRSLVVSTELKKSATENELVYLIKQVYYQLLHAASRHDLLKQQDSIYEGFLKSASLRYKTGETNLLEQTTAEVQRNEVKNNLRKNEADILAFRITLKTLLNIQVIPDVENPQLRELPVENSLDSLLYLANPGLAFSRQQMEVAKNHKRVETAKLAPDLLIGFFSQTLTGTEDPETGLISGRNVRFTGIEVGVSIPLWFIPQQARIKAAQFSIQAAQSSYENYQISLQGRIKEALHQFAKNKNSLEYYKRSALPNADLILKQSQAAFRAGEIGYAEYLMGLRNAITIKENYLQTLSDYNQSIIYIEYLSGNK